MRYAVIAYAEVSDETSEEPSSGVSIVGTNEDDEVEEAQEVDEKADEASEADAEPTAEATPEVVVEEKEPVQATDNPNVTTVTEQQKQEELHNDMQSRLAAFDAQFGISGDG